MRNEIAFASAGASCAGWHLPAATDAFAGPHGRPCVVMAHGFGGTRDTGLLAFAEGFAEAGIDAFVFDYRGLPAVCGGFSVYPYDVRVFEGPAIDWRILLIAGHLEGIRVASPTEVEVDPKRTEALPVLFDVVDGRRCDGVVMRPYLIDVRSLPAVHVSLVFGRTHNVHVIGNHPFDRSANHTPNTGVGYFTTSTVNAGSADAGAVTAMTSITVMAIAMTLAKSRFKASVIELGRRGDSGDDTVNQ